MDTSASHLFHGLVAGPVPTSLLSRFYYTGPLPDDQVSLTWLGTAGFRLEHRGTVLLLDPFVSRPGMRRTFIRRLVPDERAVARYAPRADFIVCGHSHHDHVMDVPSIARSTGATVLGPPSAYNLCRSLGLPENQLVRLEAPSTTELGPFCVTVRPSAHTPGALTRALYGQIRSGVRAPLRIRQYRSDTTFGILVEVGADQGEPLRLFHLSSADYLPETITGPGCHVLLAAITGRHNHADFTRDLLHGLRPGVVIPHHFDDFFAPMEHPVRELPSADLAGFFEEVRRAGEAATPMALRKLGTVRFTMDGRPVESDPGA